MCQHVSLRELNDLERSTLCYAISSNKQLLAPRSRLVLPSSVTSSRPLVEVLESADGASPLLRKFGNSLPVDRP